MSWPTEPIAQLKRLLQLVREGNLASAEALYLGVSIVKYALELILQNVNLPDRVWSSSDKEGEFLAHAQILIEEVNQERGLVGGMLTVWVAKALIQAIITLILKSFDGNLPDDLRLISAEVDDL